MVKLQTGQTADWSNRALARGPVEAGAATGAAIFYEWYIGAYYI